MVALLGWDFGDRLLDLLDDLVWIGLGVGTAIFEIALVPVLDEVDRHADRGAAIGQAIAELVDGAGLVEAGQAQVVVWAVGGDVRGDVLLERSHNSLEVFLAANFAERSEEHT